MQIVVSAALRFGYGYRMTSTEPLFSSPKAAFWGGVRAAAQVPMAVMGASFIGFGSMIRDMEWSVWMGVVSTLSTWAMPGQVAMAEMAQTGAPLLAVVLAVGFINARLLPMVASLLPHLRRPGVKTWVYFAIAQFIAATTWSETMRRLPRLPLDQRMHFLGGYGVLLYTGSPIATAIGWHLAGSVPQPVTLALVFLNPLYFLLLFMFDVRAAHRVLALVLGAVLGPVMFLVVPDWSLIATGLIGGTLAWLTQRMWKSRNGNGAP